MTQVAAQELPLELTVKTHKRPASQTREPADSKKFETELDAASAGERSDVAASDKSTEPHPQPAAADQSAAPPAEPETAPADADTELQIGGHSVPAPEPALNGVEPNILEVIGEEAAGDVPADTAASPGPEAQASPLLTGTPLTTSEAGVPQVPELAVTPQQAPATGQTATAPPTAAAIAPPSGARDTATLQPGGTGARPGQAAPIRAGAATPPTAGAETPSNSPPSTGPAPAASAASEAISRASADLPTPVVTPPGTGTVDGIARAATDAPPQPSTTPPVGAPTLVQDASPATGPQTTIAAGEPALGEQQPARQAAPAEVSVTPPQSNRELAAAAVQNTTEATGRPDASVGSPQTPDAGLGQSTENTPAPRPDVALQRAAGAASAGAAGAARAASASVAGAASASVAGTEAANTQPAVSTLSTPLSEGTPPDPRPLAARANATPVAPPTATAAAPETSSVLAQQTTAANPPAVSGSNSDPGSQFAIEEGTDPGQAVPRTAASPSSGAAGPASPSQAAARTAAPTSPSTTLAPVDAAATSSGAQALAPDALTTQLPTAQNGVTSSIRFGIAPQTGQPLHVPANSMAFQIARNFENGVNRFEIRIDPPELGRVNVRLDMSVEGRAQAHLTVDRPETLDLMLRDARVLERALSDAGLNTDRNSLSFSLKDEGGLGAGPHGENGNASPAGDADAVEEDTTVANAVQGYISDTGIDISV